MTTALLICSIGLAWIIWRAGRFLLSTERDLAQLTTNVRTLQNLTMSAKQSDRAWARQQPHEDEDLARKLRLAIEQMETAQSTRHGPRGRPNR